MKSLKLISLLIISLFLVSCGGQTMKTAVFETNQGNFEIELFTKEMPITTKNFIDLTNKGFYDGVKFHRVIAGFMIQGGDPISKDNSNKAIWGTGDPGYKIKDEFGEVGNLRGTLAMANSGPNSGGSQFFINVVGNGYLDSKHPVFGKVILGMDVVDKISKVQTNQQGQPLEDVIIEKIAIK
tara:strand:- start:125 stop:670 length:546 start_codon:yes stop_codon:yes gene_type:complete